MLEGIKIVDFSRYYPGPFGTARLRDMGAEVIKVEDVNGGDMMRMTDRVDGEEGAMFRFLNWGKKSVCRNLKDPDDAAAVMNLLAGADVVVEGFRPGIAKRLGIDYESVQKLNPKVVYVSISGYGQNSYLSRLGGHDPNYTAMSGLLDQLLDRDGRPIKARVALADFTSGIVACECILAGLLEVQREGRGRYFDLSMTEAVMSLMGGHIAWQSMHGDEHPFDMPCICNSIYETSDGRYMTIAAAESKFFNNFCDAMQREDLKAHQMAPDREDDPYYREMVEIFKGHNFEEWSKFAVEVDCCMAPVLHVSELAAARHVTERGMVENHWGMNVLKTYYGEPFRTDGKKPYPKLGENNEEY
ncbi:MAG TPA: CoA transferase [Clostridiales bacterium]|nr:CoA transferase [Clostridiales bacterium]